MAEPTRSQLLRRIEVLEARIAELEARTVTMQPAPSLPNRQHSETRG